MASGAVEGLPLKPMNTYLERYAYPSQLFTGKPHKSLQICLVIPCHNEPDILTTLKSINNCQAVPGVEVILVINEAVNCSIEVSSQNQQTLNYVAQWQRETKVSFTLHTHYLIAPAKDAGVGFARKVGMDEAVRRFAAIGNNKGAICCFDADSTCDPNYLITIYNYFSSNNRVPNAAVVYFEHNLPEDTHLREGIIQYELHLRYYVQSLRYINYPYAFQTVGSTIVVRSDIYQKVGGMNKRQAGEDFYFLHRVMPTGKFIDITSTTIYPSPRVSKRVPFGTGKAMSKWNTDNSTSFNTYALESFIDLGKLLVQSKTFHGAVGTQYQKLIDTLPKSIKAYLKEISFAEELLRLQKHSRDLPTFNKNWYTFFNGFRVLKYIHYARDNYYANKPIAKEAGTLGKMLWPKEISEITDTEKLLNLYRIKARNS